MFRKALATTLAAALVALSPGLSATQAFAQSIGTVQTGGSSASGVGASGTNLGLLPAGSSSLLPQGSVTVGLVSVIPGAGTGLTPSAALKTGAVTEGLKTGAIAQRQGLGISPAGSLSGVSSGQGLSGSAALGGLTSPSRTPSGVSQGELGAGIESAESSERRSGPSQGTPPSRHLSRASKVTVESLRRNESIRSISDPKADKALALGTLFTGDAQRSRPQDASVTPVDAGGMKGSVGGLKLKPAGAVDKGNETTGAAADSRRPDKSVAAKAEARRSLAGWAIGALAVVTVAGVGAFFAGVGLPWIFGAAATLGVAAVYQAAMARQAAGGRVPAGVLAMRAELMKRGGVLLRDDRGGFLSMVRRLAEAKGVPTPEVVVLPELKERARTDGMAGSTRALLVVTPELLSNPDREVVVAHELQHVADLGRRWASFPNFASGAMLLGALAAPWAMLFNGVDAGTMGRALAAVAIGVPAMILAKALHLLLLEVRGDAGAVAQTGDEAGLKRALGSIDTPWKRFVSVLRGMGGLGARFGGWLGRMGLGMPNPTPSTTPPDPTKPEYYAQKPEWAEKIGADPEGFADDAAAAKHAEQVAKLRPLARWMARFYLDLKDDQVMRPPNLLTLQDVLDWVAYIKKFDATPGWKLDAKDEPILREGKPLLGRDGNPVLMGSIVLEGAKSTFLKTLPSETYEGRDLQREVEVKLKAAAEVFGKLEVPKHLEGVALKAPAPAKDDGGEMAEFIDEKPTLFEAQEIGGVDEMDYILTKTVKERLADLMTLYSLDHKKKFFPLIIGDTGEGKSSLVKYMFTQPGLLQARGIDGRRIPVVSIPVKEAMTRRELLGGKGPRGVELGFLALAAMNGWVLVLEELNQASGEFLKSLNDVLHQIRKQGFFTFEVGGKTVKVKAHPHFWVVGTENGDDGNYSMSRNPHSPDFVKRWKTRYYSRFPPAEQAEIMKGLSTKWYGAEFVDRHGADLNFFEELVTQFHEPLRKMAVSGKIGGDSQEPYEFNRRTLLRALKRYLHDLSMYEAMKRKVDDKTRKTLLARELMEAYGSELRFAGERDALWDLMNKVFELESKHGIQPEDIAVEVRGFAKIGGRLVVDEKLMPMELSVRANGGDRVPGADKRLTLIPSLAANVYRNLRNRAFREDQVSTGPTGTAKTAEQFFVNHMLGEPLFDMTLDEQTPMSEFHGGFVKDPQSGDFSFAPGILARAMAYDPEGLLKREGGKTTMTPAEVRRSQRLGATLLINEGNASPILESINPARDDRMLNLSDGQHTAVAGGAFYITVTINPVGEGYVGYPMTGAFKSRAQTVEHPGELTEDELTEVIIDQMTGVTRFQIAGEKK